MLALLTLAIEKSAKMLNYAFLIYKQKRNRHTVPLRKITTSMSVTARVRVFIHMIFEVSHDNRIAE